MFFNSILLFWEPQFHPLIREVRFRFGVLVFVLHPLLLLVLIMQCICIFQYTGSEGNAYEDSSSIGFSRKQQMLHGLFLPTLFFLLMNYFNVSKKNEYTFAAT
jgi:hypothetical protein